MKNPDVLIVCPSEIVGELVALSEQNVGATIILDVKRRSFEDTVLNEIIMDAEGLGFFGRTSLIASIIKDEGKSVVRSVRSGDARVFQKGILGNIYDTKSPGHDGAVVISVFKDGKVCVHLPATQCWLPIDGRRKDRKEGTRHGSAKTLSLLTRAPIFVISEERGTVSYAFGGRLERDVSVERLKRIVRASVMQELVREVRSANFCKSYTLFRYWSFTGPLSQD